MLKKNSKSRIRISKFKLAMTLGFTALIVAAIIIVSVLILTKTNNLLKDKVSSMTSALNIQMKMNMDSYLDRMESTGTLAFSAEEAYTYAASDETADSFETLQTESIISDELYDLCIMENYVDFGIVYSNNHTVGKISNGTIDLFGDRIYSDLSAMINRVKTSDGWSAGYNGDFKRIYYVKRMNENAVLVTSFYASELQEVFRHPGGIEDMSVRLVDGSDTVIYSSEEGEAGKQLPKDISDSIGKRSSAVVIDNNYLITSSLCGDDWKIICSVPTAIILKENSEMIGYVAIVAVAASLLAFLLVLVFSDKISDPVKDMMDSLATKASMDQLTQLFNKKSFEELATEALKENEGSGNYCMMILDIDSFKLLNDNLGHAVGDKVLAEVGSIMRKLFKTSAYLGRLGGDEFGAFFELPDKEAERKALVQMRCEKLCEAFRSNYADNEKKFKVSVSAGAACFPSDAKNFQQLYSFADIALYKAKRSGKDTFRIYGEEDEQTTDET